MLLNRSATVEITRTARILLRPPFHTRQRICQPSSNFRSSKPRSSNRIRPFTILRSLRGDNEMASDAEYMSFLDKANEDPGKGVAGAKSRGTQGQFKTTDAGVAVPAVLRDATRDAFYVSDADEPFVPVALRLGGGSGSGLPDEEQLARLINHPDPANAEVEILDPVDWDTQGQYKDIIDAVTKAGKGNDVRVYKISKGDGVRVEYWVVTTTEGEGGDATLVGVKALAVES